MGDVLLRMIKAIQNFANPALVAAVAALMLAVGLSAQSAQTPVQEKTAAEVYKNIQVLKDIPASQLLPGMRYMTTALGVECNFCHVEEHFPSDDKQTKQTARQMMTMLFAINNNNFDGRSEVSCFTCHQGHHEPMGIPALPAEAVEPQFSPLPQGAPTVDAVLAKFAQAIGGEEALDKITTRVLQIELIVKSQTYPMVAYQKGGKMYAAVITPKGPKGGVYDSSFRAEGFDDIVLSRQAQMNPIAALQDYKAKRLRGQAQIGDAMTYVVQATAPDGRVEFLFFDQQSGLLIRRTIRNRTIFGVLPVETDYSDFRPTDGVDIPYKLSCYTSGSAATFMVKDVKNNVPVDDSKFAPPEKKP